MELNQLSWYIRYYFLFTWIQVEFPDMICLSEVISTIAMLKLVRKMYDIMIPENVNSKTK